MSAGASAFFPPGEGEASAGREVMVRHRERGPLRLAHVASHNRRYPGERVTFCTRVEAAARVGGFRVQVGLPPEMTPGDLRASANHGEGLPEVVHTDGRRYALWTVERAVAAGEVFEYEADAVARPTPVDLEAESLALARPAGAPDEAALAETAAVLISAKGRYLQHLPRVYQEQDELMGRFLMLFESFWAPIEGQIDAVPYYFDPEFTPSELLPWLATWVDLALDERWPEAKRRKLLRAAVSLYRKRGTRRGLQEYLEIYTGARVQISEHGANNFTLGPQARLGPGVALGTLNMPHTFTVTVFLSSAENGGEPPPDPARFEAERRRMVEAIIEAEKPAHTSYQLRFQAV